MNSQNNVSDAISLLQKTLEEERNRIFNAGSDAMKQQDIETARGVLDFVEKIDDIIDMVNKLNSKWNSMLRECDKSTPKTREVVKGEKPVRSVPTPVTSQDILNYVNAFKTELCANRRSYLNYFKSRKIKAQKIARCALKYAIEKKLIDERELIILCDKSTATLFKGGGWPILKLTNGDSQDYYDSYGHNRYCSMPPIKLNGKMFLISHELYNDPHNDSVTPLVFLLIKHGMPVELIESLCSELSPQNNNK